MEENKFKKINFIKKILACALYLIAIICCFISTMAYVNYLDNAKSTYEQQEVMVKNTRYAVSEDSGTAIPTSGYIENVYFNTDLDNETIFNIFNSFEYFDSSSLGYNGLMVPLIVSSNMEKLLFVEKQEHPTFGTYFRIYALLGETLSDNLYIYDTIEGWRVDSFKIDVDNVLSELSSQYNIKIYNDNLSNIVSITPFSIPTLTESFLGGVASASGQFLAVLTSAFSSVENVFLTTEGELTLVGMFLAISIGAVVITFAIRLLIKLINKIRLNG